MNFNSLLKDYDFDLPPELIATEPAKSRDASRLMVLERKTGAITIFPGFNAIADYLQAPDLVVTNQTRVSKRRVFLRDSKGRIFESVFLEAGQDLIRWKCLLKNARKLNEGDLLVPVTGGGVRFKFTRQGDEIILESSLPATEEIFELIGTIPIPPYLKRRATPDDNLRYQTIFAGDKSGSVAAPTAGLHFTPELMEIFKQKGIRQCNINLTIGYGTFSPLNEEQWAAKKLHQESFSVSSEAARLLTEQKARGDRIISVGTTTLRTLETIHDPASGTFRAGSGVTDIFLRPGDRISSIDGLVTNFHLPASSLLLLVAAFAGKEFIMEAYKKAIENGMRFYSYGDAMLIV